MIATDQVEVGKTYSSQRWRGDRQVTAITTVRLDGLWSKRVDYVNPRTSRASWTTLRDFAALATLKESKDT